jgi:hypothetical protein
VVALVGLAGFVFGVVQFVQIQAVEAEKPYLERKLAWCEEAVETTSRLANSVEPVQADIERFWQMYWGVMGLIEKETITAAMIDFGQSLRKLAPSAGGSNDTESQLSDLRGKSLSLAHACRKELASEWSPSWL